MYNIYCKSLLLTSISYVQESFKLNEINHGKSVFLYWWFSFELWYYLILSGTNTVQHTSAEKFFVHSVESGTSKNSCNNINNSHAQVFSCDYGMSLLYIFWDKKTKQILFMGIKISLPYKIFSLVIQSINLFWKIAV